MSIIHARMPLAVAAALACPWALALEPLGCVIEPDATTALGSALVGVVREIRVDRGDVVHRGDVIAVLDDAVARAAVASARSRAASNAEILAAEANVALTAQRQSRAEDLNARKMIAQDTLDDAETQASLAERKLEQARDNQRTWRHELDLAEARLEQHVIRSPIDGIVADRLMSPGERVEEQPLVRIARVDPLRVELVMPAASYGRVAEGTTIGIRPELPHATSMTAAITRVDRIMDAASNTYRVRLTMPNPGQQVPAGTRCNADLVLSDEAEEVATGELGTAAAGLQLAGQAGR